MAKTVYSFSAYANTFHVFETCVSAMERGLLHVDATNVLGWTLGFLFVENGRIFNNCVWDRYWALRPDVSLFWRLIACHNNKVSFSTYLKEAREALYSTPALWADLALVQPAARKCGFIEKVHARIRESCRFAWIAAVVAE